MYKEPGYYTEHYQVFGDDYIVSLCATILLKRSMSAMIYKAMASGRFGRVMNVVATTGMPEVKGDKSGKTFDGYNDAIGEIDRIIGSQEQN